MKKIKLTALLVIIISLFLTCGDYYPQSTEDSYPQGTVKPPSLPEGSGPGGGNTGGPVLSRWTGNEGTWYQIFTIAFYDSNGNGKGDLQGIIQNLWYLSCLPADCDRSSDPNQECNKSLHVDGIWLTPIMTATSYHKYDTIDYMQVDPDFGDLDDMRRLVAATHERGMKIIVDLAVNHSGSMHWWFQAALNEWKSGTLGKYASYYNIRAQNNSPGDGWHSSWNAGSDTDNGRTPDGRQIWFYGSFGPWMPDINWDNPALLHEFDLINKFWLVDMNLDGYRLDATKHIYENGRFNGDTDRNIAFWTWFADNVRKHKPNAYMVGECLDDEGTVLYYHKPGMGSFALGFANDYGRISGAVLRGDGRNFAEGVMWMTREVKNLHPHAVFAPFLSNHDFDRSSNWLTWDEERKMAASLLLLSPGTPFLYYGEEIGLIGFKVPGDEMVRGPMIFSMQNSTGRPNSSNWNMHLGTNNPQQGLPAWQEWQGLGQYGGGVNEQIANERSLLRHYIKVQNMKNRYPWIAWGNADAGGIDVDGRGQVSAYRVTDDNPQSPTFGKSVVIAHNVYKAGGEHGYISVPRATGYETASAVHLNHDEQPDPEPVIWDSGLSAYWIKPYTTVIFREYE
ncbi:MAG: alpha-amylase family glycosyl hydrolase [Treponema sp.]|nr:alpha-amylase family glycosyl hydrolase [Treponema sp.]